MFGNFIKSTKMSIACLFFLQNNINKHKSINESRKFVEPCQTILYGLVGMRESIKIESTLFGSSRALKMLY
jgi:hypothetical protein